MMGVGVINVNTFAVFLILLPERTILGCALVPGVITTPLSFLVFIILHYFMFIRLVSMAILHDARYSGIATHLEDADRHSEISNGHTHSRRKP